MSDSDRSSDERSSQAHLRHTYVTYAILTHVLTFRTHVSDFRLGFYRILLDFGAFKRILNGLDPHEVTPGYVYYYEYTRGVHPCGFLPGQD